MEEIQLSDLLESYMSPMTPGFQTMITAKKEFSELASYVGERKPKGKGFQPFRHQKFTHRFLRAYDNLLILSETGTGKSCEVLGFTEYTRRELEKAKLDPSKADEKAAHFKRVIILVKGPAQKNEFRNQLACKCSDGHYGEAEGVKKAKTESAQKAALSAEIKKAGYVITTYATFSNRLNAQYGPEDDDKIAEDYSDTIFWIDEAHNLVVDQNTGANTQKQETYRTIWRVLHLAKRSKKIISTATPMINEVNEVGSLFNLLLPLPGELPSDYNYQTAPENDIRVLFPGLPFDHRTATPEQIAPYFIGQFPENYDFSKATLQDLEPMIRGKIGFIRANNTGAVPREQGIDFNEEHEPVPGIKYTSQLKLYATTMSQHQTTGYLRSKQAGRGDDLFVAQRQASNFVFPDGTWGNGPSEAEGKQKGGFRKYVAVKGDTFSARPELASWLKDLDSIRTLSSKYAEIVRLVKEAEGNCFVYGEFVEGSGVIALALCLEGLGFERYNETTSMFVGLATDIVKPLCSGGEAETETRRVRQDVRPKLRYAILTRDTSDTQFQSMMEAMNSYENRHGDYIKVLISSRVGRDAINVNNVRQIHLIGAEWNQSAMYQAFSRGLRATSHEDILNEEKQRALERGEDPEAVVIPVDIYKHAAVADTPDQESIDLEMYHISEFKDRNIRRVMRIMKQVAVGCQVHRKRNVRPGDVDGTPSCDYQECDYQCVDPPPDEEDFTTYDVIYSQEVLDTVIRDLTEIYRTENSFTLEDIFSLLSKYRRKYILITLERLTTNKIPITDRFGYPTYLREDKGIFYLDRTYPTGEPSHLMSYYSTGLIGIQEASLNEIVNELASFENETVLDILKKINPKSEKFSQLVDELNIDLQVQLLENAILDELEGKATAFTEAVISKFQRMIIVLNEPVSELTRVYEELAQNRPKRGRKPNPDIKKRVKKINLVSVDESKLLFDEDTEQVYLHILYSQVADTTNYAATARFNKGEGRTRILKPSNMEAGWKDVNEIELPIYNTFIQLEIVKRNKPFEEKGIYGFVLPDGKFRISNKLTEGDNTTGDARKIKRGKVCSTWNKLDLVDIMWEIGMPPVAEVKVTQKNRKEILDELSKIVTDQDFSDWTLEKIAYYFAWHTDKTVKRNEICDLIKDYMDKTDRLIK